MKYLKLKKTSPEERKKKKENERRNKSRLEREMTNKDVLKRYQLTLPLSIQKRRQVTNLQNNLSQNKLGKLLYNNLSSTHVILEHCDCDQFFRFMTDRIILLCWFLSGVPQPTIYNHLYKWQLQLTILTCYHYYDGKLRV